MVDLTAEYLTRFLNDIDADSLTKNQQFEKEYHFNSSVTILMAFISKTLLRFVERKTCGFECRL